MYKLNTTAKYTAKPRNTPKIDLVNQRLYFNTTESVDLMFPDIFDEYPISLNTDEWKMTHLENNFLIHNGFTQLQQYFRYYRAQINFAVHCATTALGISREHLTHGSLMLQSFYRFHVYYHVRRVLKKIGVLGVHETDFSKFNSRYDKTGYYEVCSEYNVDPTSLWIVGDWPYTPYGASFSTDDTDGKKVIKSIWVQKFLPSSNYCSFMLVKSNGITNLNLISESIRVYTYLLLNSQIAARSNMNSPGAKQIFLDLLEDAIKRPLNTQDDIKRYQGIITKSRSKLDFPVAVGVYIMPSDMSLIHGKINGFNNAILISSPSMKIGEINESLNKLQKPTKPFEQKPVVKDRTRDVSSKEHEEEKQLLVIVGTSLIVLAIWFFK